MYAGRFEGASVDANYMIKHLLWTVVFLLVNSAVVARCLTPSADTIAPDYDRAVDRCLFHQFAEAESLLYQIARRPDHPNREDARFLLMEEVYFKRNQYQSYLRFADSTGQKPVNYAVAKLLVNQPMPRFNIPADSILIPLQVSGWPIAHVVIHGKPYRFIVDTGAEHTFISSRLTAELQLSNLLNDSAINSLRQTIPAIYNRIDTLRLGELTVTNLPVMQASMAFFPADGLLGWDILRQFCFTIDYATQQLVLRKPVLRPTSVRNLLGITRLLLAFQATAGNQLNLFLDTGSNAGISLTPIGVTKIGPYKTGHRLGLQAGIGGRVRIGRQQTVKRTSARVGERQLALKRVRIESTNEIICSVLKDGTVGSKQFKKGRLTIDYLNNHFEYID